MLIAEQSSTEANKLPIKTKAGRLAQGSFPFIALANPGPCWLHDLYTAAPMRLVSQTSLILPFHYSSQRHGQVLKLQWPQRLGKGQQLS
jgi:hypothetical protein